MSSESASTTLIARLGSAILMPFSWSDAAAVASLADGYRLADDLGIDELGDWANRRLAIASASGSWTGDATALWLCLFYEHRRWRHFGEQPDGVSLRLLDELCGALLRAVGASAGPAQAPPD